MTTSQSRDSRGGGGRPGTRRFTSRRRRQCVCKEVGTVGYKDVSVLRRFISDRGRIESGRKSGNCAKCQRELSTAIARARFLALLPYAPNHVRVTGSIAPAASSAASEEEPDETEDIEDSTAVVASDDEPETTDGSDASDAADSVETEESPASEVNEESAEDESADESEETSASVESSEESSVEDSAQADEAEESEEEEKE